jgi:hypothetical protein
VALLFLPFLLCFAPSTLLYWLLAICGYYLLWMHKSIFVFTVDRTMTSSSCITSDYDPKTDIVLKGNLGDPGWKYIYWPNHQNKDVVACTVCGISFYGGI